MNHYLTSFSNLALEKTLVPGTRNISAVSLIESQVPVKQITGGVDLREKM